MAALQRSAVSFRRQGSSGVVWNDQFLIGELKPTSNRDDAGDQLRHSRSVGSSSATRFERSRSSRVAHRMEVVLTPSPASDPSSPKFAGCGFCGVFGRPIGGPRHQKSNKRLSE